MTGKTDFYNGCHLYVLAFIRFIHAICLLTQFLKITFTLKYLSVNKVHIYIIKDY